MSNMFQNASAFNQNISGWVVDNVIQKPPTDFSTGSALTVENSPIWFPVVLESNQVTNKFIGNVPTGSENPFFVTSANVVYAVMRNSQDSIDKINAYAIGTSGASAPFTHSTAGVIPFNRIVTTLMTNMTSMFSYATTFNSDISSWDTSNVTNMRLMFLLSLAFNGNLSNWNTSKVTDMDRMFSFAYSFNKNIGSWDVSKVTNMYGMFQYAIIFNQNLSGWNVALTPTRPSLERSNFADGSPLALPENSTKLPPFQ